MNETGEDLRNLQRLLDESYAAAGTHLRSIFTPERLCTAADVVDGLQGVFIIHLATVTARGEPRTAPLDGLFYRGRLFFGLPRGSVRARHLLARPRVSASHANGDFCVIVHGLAVELTPDHPLAAEYGEFARAQYGLPAVAFNDAMYKHRTEPEFNGYIDAWRLYAQGKPPD